MPSLLYASSNPGKIREVRAYALAQQTELLVPSQLGLSLEVEEDAGSLEGNALKKARAWSQLAPGHIVLADDTGLEIEALGGQPGVYVRRWKDGKTEMSDEEIVQHCLEQMRGVPEGERGAQFRTVIAIVWPDGREQWVSGTLRGSIMSEPYGGCLDGFPFAALLYVEEWGMMLGAQHSLPPQEQEGLLTHRTKALEAAFTLLSSQAE